MDLSTTAVSTKIYLPHSAAVRIVENRGDRVVCVPRGACRSIIPLLNRQESTVMAPVEIWDALLT